jgi:CubicO group peptidase (beta-lactamase class C family)
VSALERDLERLMREAQAERVPSVAAAVLRRGEPVWSAAVGLADADAGTGATPETQYRIGSVPKSFTTVAILQLVEDGSVGLDDPLERHIAEAPAGSPTLRRLLSHLSGLPREPPGDLWQTLAAPTAAELVAQLGDAEPVLPPHVAHHYSNLAFGLLGEVVARAGGSPYRRHVEERILRPLELRRTTWDPVEPYARGYFVEPYANVVRPEPVLELAGIESAGQLWSTASDLVRWATVLADGHPGVLRAETVEAMWFPHASYDPDEWLLSWGLGLMLYREGGRILGGHGGAMPGHLAGVVIDRDSKIAAAVLANTTAGADPEGLARRLALAAIEALPEPPKEWRPEPGPPPELGSALGRWWSEGTEFVFYWEDGALKARLPAARRRLQPSRFEPLGGDLLRTAAGRERGELLRLERDEDGSVVRMTWAGYPFTRAPAPFGGRPG